MVDATMVFTAAFCGFCGSHEYDNPTTSYLHFFILSGMELHRELGDDVTALNELVSRSSVEVDLLIGIAKNKKPGERITDRKVIS